MSKTSYSSQNITILKELEAVRVRPGMYIGSTDVRGLHHILWEIIDNAVDEAANGFAKEVKVCLYDDGSASVEDDGRGMPVDIHPDAGVSGVQVIFTQLHAGGKFNSENYAYSGGLHGVGASVTNALSEWLKVEVYNKTVYKMEFSSYHKADSEFVAGKYKDVSPEYGYDVLLALFLPETKGRQEISVSIPEGYTVDDIIELFVSKGIGTKEAFVEVINTYEFDTERYWFLQDVPLITDPENDPRIYRLEGFLYPDTYRFYDSYTDKEGDTPGTAAAKAVITKLLDQFKNNFKKSFFLKQQKYMEENFPDAPKLTVYEILTIASILEKEGVAEERNLISAVFYNRLQHPEHEGIGGKLESNAVTQYALRHDGYKVSSEFGEFELNYETPYNSYKYAGLPPTPIVTPTLDSLNAALYPAEGLDYFFFVATDSGYSFFASTLAEHLENVERAKNGEVADSPFPDEEEGDDYP